MNNIVNVYPSGLTRVVEVQSPGPRGARGKAFEYEDFTPEQIEILSGEDAYVLWTRIPGNEDKSFQDWLDWIRVVYVGSGPPPNTSEVWINPEEYQSYPVSSEFGEGSNESTSQLLFTKSKAIFNISKTFPKLSGYYTFTTARTTTPEILRTKGIILTWEDSEGVWITQRFLGGDWNENTNWELLPQGTQINYLDSLNEKKSNKTEIINSNSTHTQYPSAKSVYDLLPISVIEHSLSVNEVRVGKIDIFGNEYDLYETLFVLENLPTTLNEEKSYIVSDSPLGFNIYLAIREISFTNEFNMSFNHNIGSIKVQSISTNNSLQTEIKLKCTEESIDISDKLLLRVIYIKPELIESEFELTVPEGLDVGTLNVRFADLKYNKQMAFGITSDDNLITGWNVVFKYLQGQWIDDSRFYHIGYPRTTGSYAPKPLTYTDSCGITRRFPISTAIFPNYKKSLIENMPINANPNSMYMTFPEIREILDFDGAVLLHDIAKAGSAILNNGDGTLPITTEEVIEGINECQTLIRASLNEGTIGIGIPGGTIDSLITEGAMLHPELKFMHKTDNVELGFARRNLRATINQQNKVRLGRIFLEASTNVNDYKNHFNNNYASVRSDSTAMWGELGLHGSDKNNPDVDPLRWVAFSEFVTWLNDTYGAEGDDTLWFATGIEVFQYYILKTQSKVGIAKNGNKLKVKTLIPKYKDFRFYELTLLMDNVQSNTVSFSNSSEDIIGLSIGDTSNVAQTVDSLMININYSNYIIESAEKYVSKYEEGVGLGFAVDILEELRDSAEYFIQRLLPSLQQPFIQRLESVVTPLVLNSISINSGDLTTESTSIVISINKTGAATHYKVSESSSLIGAEWESYNSEINFNLSSGVGVKTVYIKLKNALSESEIVSDTIELVATAPVFTVLASVNDNSYGSISPESQQVQQGSSAQVTATANQGYLIESWGGVDSGTGVGTPSGVGTITDLQDDAVIVVNFEEEPPLPPTMMVLSATADNISQVGTTTSDEKIISKVWPGNSTTTDSFNIYDTEGNIAGVRVCRTTLLPDNTNMNNSAGANPTLSGDTGPYADSLINKLWGVYDNNVYPTLKGLQRFIIDEGTYNIRILYSTATSLTSAKIQGMIYIANGVQASIPAGFNPVNNTQTFIEINNVVVDQTGVLDIYFGNTQTYTRAGYNLIELTKI